MKFRRKSAQADPSTGETTAEETPEEEAPASGPFDFDDVEGDGVARIDLGSLLLVPEEGRELRIQLADNSDDVQAVVLAGADGAVEVRAYAAPRNGDLWSTVRPQLAADMARRGGLATEREGRFGTELLCELWVPGPDGKQRKQISRVVGINGPRWMLRATLLGHPAANPESAGSWEDTISNIAVRRGDHAMPVGDALPFVLPRQTGADEAAPVSGAEA